jgi:hypothetical protein
MRSSFLAVMLSAAPHLLGAQVPSPEIQIAGAVQAAPEALRAGAAVLGYSNYHRMTTLRAGTNDLICLADDPSVHNWHVACYHKDLEPFMARGRELRDEGKSRPQIDSTRLAEIQAGTLKMPEGPHALYNLYAPADSVDPATGLAHSPTVLNVIYIPYATPETTGLPLQPTPGLPWIMSPGKPWAHVMIMK